ncbi:hypothetical protein C8R44DRAFT_726569 [Mycena epipterygia]|nr:hypothetical protein C8R44DRAFT_726569 [Mycena epipterygia]
MFTQYLVKGYLLVRIGEYWEIREGAGPIPDAAGSRIDVINSGEAPASEERPVIECAKQGVLNFYVKAESAAATADIATGAIAVTTAIPTTAAAADVNNIATQVAAASAPAASVHAAAIATGAPGEEFEFHGEEAGLETKLALDTQAGDKVAAAQDQADRDACNEGAGGGFWVGCEECI